MQKYNVLLFFLSFVITSTVQNLLSGYMYKYHFEVDLRNKKQLFEFGKLFLMMKYFKTSNCVHWRKLHTPIYYVKGKK